MTEEEYKDKYTELAGKYEFDAGMTREDAEYQADKDLGIQIGGWSE